MSGRGPTFPRPGRSDDHVVTLLPDLAGGRLDDLSAARVRAHLNACEACRTELRSWQAVREAASAWGPDEASLPEGMAGRVMAAVRREVGADQVAGLRAIDRSAGSSEAGVHGAPARLRWLVQFVLAQAPVVRREIWPASTVVLLIGAALSVLATTNEGGVPGQALSLLAPLAAAIGIAMIYGADNDPALELALASPTSPRIVVVARLVLVLAWDVALALAASAVLAIVDGPALFLPIVALWLGPMLLLGCLCLLLSLLVQPSLAIGVAMVLWAVRALAVVDGSRLAVFRDVAGSLDAFWQTTPLTLVLALVLLAAAVFVAPYREPFPSRRAI